MNENNKHPNNLKALHATIYVLDDRLSLFSSYTQTTHNPFERAICCMNYFMIELRLIVNESDAVRRSELIH